MQSIVCKNCQATFKARQKSRMYCSRRCGKAYRKKTKPELKWVMHEHTRKCDICREKYLAKRTDSRFCSMKCMNAHKRQRAMKERVCFVCGVKYKGYGAKTCSKKCHNQYLRIYKQELRFGPERNCTVCERVFRGGEGFFKEYCSISCREEGKRRTKKFHKQRRRALKKVTIIEKFRAETVFERDGYICQHCGCKTRMDVHHTDPRYPNLDHIIPLSAGGTHTLKNTQCLCAGCNNKKRAGALCDQLLLFG